MLLTYIGMYGFSLVVGSLILSKKKIGHPAPFPKELPYRCIKLFSYVNDVVFDPFAGSSTTLVVAKNTNRIGVGVELDSTYCKISKNRIIAEAEGFEF